MRFDDLFDNWRSTLYTPQRWASTLARCFLFWFAVHRLPRCTMDEDILIIHEES